MMTCFRKGLCYNGCDCLSQAYKYFKKAAEMSKMQNPNILIQLSMACIKVGEIDEGIDDLDLSLIKAGYNLDIMYTINSSIAGEYLQKKNYKKCAYHLQQALLFRPNSYITIFKIAQTYGLIKDAANEKSIIRCSWQMLRTLVNLMMIYWDFVKLLIAESLKSRKQNLNNKFAIIYIIMWDCECSDLFVKKLENI